MTKRKRYPTEIHRRILEAASRRAGLLALPLPDGVHGAVARTVVDKLIELGWLEEVPANTRLKDPLWRETREQGGLTLVATEAGLKAIEIDPVVCRTVSRARRKIVRSVCEGVSKAASIRSGTKQAKLIDLLKRDEGASLPEICAATGWQAHSARGAVSGSIRKKLGLKVETVSDPERGRVYRIVGSAG